MHLATCTRWKARRDAVRQLPTGTVTLLFTDIEGSTRLLQRLGERYASVLKKCRHLLRMAFQQGNGYEVDTQGDAFFSFFEPPPHPLPPALLPQPPPSPPPS